MKNTIIVILALSLLGLGAWTFYTLKYTVPARAEAECTKACTSKTTQIINDKVGEVATQAEKCVVILEQLKKVPECAVAIQTALDTDNVTNQATTTTN